MTAPAPFAAGSRPARRQRELVLVGGGHAHVQVLRRFAMQHPPRARLTLVVDTPIAVYSGMVPGHVAGQYRAAELEIDVLPLARRARARVVLAPATGVDARRQRIEIEGRPSIPYDVASFDIGSTVAGLELPGIRRHAFPTRPIGRFVRRLDELAERLSAATPGRVVVVGGGAGGVELAFCLAERLRRKGVVVETTLIQNQRQILPGYPRSLRRRVERRAAAAGVRIVCGRRVEAAEEGSVLLDGGESMACHALVWVTGAVGHPLFERSGLPTDDRGFLLVRPTLQARDHDELFAAGDCATLIEHPETPKAGVYAVRQGPVVAGNLAAWLAGEPLQRYEPQADFLTLLNTGNGEALGAKWGLSAEGRWVMRLKDRIDRRFMRRFQVLNPDGSVTPEFSADATMDGDGRGAPCGGCAAKVGQNPLARALARLGAGPSDPSVALGLESSDDAAAYSVGDRRLVVTSLDAFRAFTDDPHLVGRVAAVNAVSDLQAKGVSPRYALALVAVPQEEEDDRQEESLYQVLSGARAVFDPLGVTLLGGHSTTAPELLVGFAVDAIAGPGDSLLRLDALRPDQALVLTKPLGTGVLLHADMHGRARGPWLLAAFDSMLRGNRDAARIAVAGGAGAATDVTGFGLAGHLIEMLRASGLSATVELSALPALPGAVELLSLGVRSTFHLQNARALGRCRIEPRVTSHPLLDLLCDPQTSGGLLFGVDAARVEETLDRLHEVGECRAARIGFSRSAREDGALVEIVE